MKSEVEIKTFEGSCKIVNKLAIYADIDKAGEVFYKIEGQDGKKCCAIRLERNIKDAETQMLELVKNLLIKQTKDLERKSRR